MKDKTFGEIEYDYGWNRPYSYSIFGRTYSVTLAVPCAEGKEIEIAQRDAFVQFELAKNRFAAAAAEAVYRHYLEVADEVRERVGPERAVSMAPVIRETGDLAKIVTPTEIVVQQSFAKEKRVIGLLFDCSWEPELGLAVKFEDEILTEVGTQDIVL